VHAVVGLDAEGRMYLPDLWRTQAAADAWGRWNGDDRDRPGLNWKTV
jgi:hypothetical protein